MRNSWPLKLLRHMHRFGEDKTGNVAVIFAIVLVPLIGLVGMGIDYSRASMVQAQMQSSIDATALALSKEAANDTNSQLQTDALNIFNVNFNQPSLQNLAVTASYTTSGGTSVAVTASGSLPTDFLAILGINTIPLSATSTAKWGMSRLRVALVLDNTGSMSQYGKLTALQTATKNLLSQLQSAATTNGDVYVSIIPFVKDVNLDPSNYAATWIDWTDWDAANGTCSKSGGGTSTQSGCLAKNGKWTPNSHTTWNGCVVDRGDETQPDPANYDTNVTAPSTSITATLYSAEQYPYCPQAAMGLSYNWSAMTTLVNNMVAAGNTNQAIGLQLGWLSLAGGGPFTAPAMDPNYTYQQVIIILTDGLNTQDRWYTTQSLIDARQQMTCDNIKAAGITLYTIQVNTDGDPTSTLLQNCASDSSKFFLLTSSNEIVTTFNTIGTNLSNLYIAK